MLTIPVIFIFVGCLAVALDVTRTAQGDFWLQLPWFAICATHDTLNQAARLCARSFGAVSALYLLTLTTPSWEVISALGKLHVPKLVLELMNLIYRYIFILYEVFCTMQNAATARLGYKNFQTSCRTFGGVAGSLLLVSLKRANTYYDALEARCYDGDLLFYEEKKKVTAQQLTTAVLLCLGLCAVWYRTKWGTV